MDTVVEKQVYSIVSKMQNGKGSTEATFSKEHSLPSLPLPSLDETLSRYLESARVFLNDEEYSRTKEIADRFATGVGDLLHSKLMLKAQSERNWVSHSHVMLFRIKVKIGV